MEIIILVKLVFPKKKKKKISFGFRFNVRYYWCHLKKEFPKFPENGNIEVLKKTIHPRAARN